MSAIYATITIQLSNDGMFIKCDDTETTEYIKKNKNGKTNMQPLVDFINDVEDIMDPDVTYQITEEGLRYLKMIEEMEKNNKNTTGESDNNEIEFKKENEKD